MQYFYSSIAQVRIRTKLKPLLIEAWNLAINLENGKSSEKDIISTLKERYSDYMTLTGHNLPSPGSFENALIKTRLREIPDFGLKQICGSIQ